MAGYVELTSGYALSLTQFAQTGQRKFVEKAGGARSLPILGSSFNDTYPLCKARRIEEHMFGDHDTKKIWTVHYDTNVPTDGEDDDFDDLPKSVEVSSEHLNVGTPPTSQTWDGGGAINQDMYRRIIMATVNITKQYSTFRKLMEKLRICMGKINEVKFLIDDDEEQFLLSGCHAEEIVNVAGVKVWRAEFSFTFRAPVLNDESYGNWQHLWNEDAWDFDVPINPPYRLIDLKKELL